MEKENQKAILGLITVIKEKVPSLKYIEVRDIESVCIRIKDLEKILKEMTDGLEKKVKTLTELLEDAGTYLMDYEKHTENGYYGLAEESYQNLKDVLSDYI